MDLLITPADPAFPTEPAPFFKDVEPWAGDPFLTYGSKRGLSTLGELKELNPDALCGFLQTQFFFGLLAELLCLNRLQNGRHIIDPEIAGRERNALYEECIFEVNGQKFITGAKALASGPLMLKRGREAAAAMGGMAPRLAFVDECLRAAHRTVFQPELADRITFEVKYSLAALGELFATAIHSAVAGLGLPLQFHSISLAWPYGYLSEGGSLEAQMLDHGWCPSEIEKVRTECWGLNGSHYISRLKKHGEWKGHATCHKYQCSNFQIKLDEYQPAHAETGCPCGLVSVDLDNVMDILERTPSYPVLTGNIIKSITCDREEVQVKAFEQGMPYVAISHVWADGLGNPRDNSLPRCQIERVNRLVADLQRLVDPEWGRQGRPAYQVWIDPLCCPVKWEGKKISLERIADVYRKSTHTLVLDNSFTTMPSENVHPADLLFRVLTCSAWMRRLWTFQEGALPQSLYFQFADRAIAADTLFLQIHEASAKDSRYIRLLHDLWRAMSAFAKFSPRKTLGVSTQPVDPQENPYDVLVKLQWALNFRSVSVPKDEALCIATLLDLEVTHIVLEDGMDAAQKRMAIVWGMLAKRLNGLPPKVIFFVDNPLNIEGFRWAPRSFLAGAAESSATDNPDDPYAERQFLDSSIDLNHRTVRFFTPEPGSELGQVVQETDRKGFRVTFPGYRFRVRAHRPADGNTCDGQELHLHPWDTLFALLLEDRIILKEEQTGTWFQLCNYDYTQKARKRTLEAKQLWWKSNSRQVCRLAETGQSALIRNVNSSSTSAPLNRPQPEAGLLVLIDQEDDKELCVRRQFNAILTELSPAGALVAETMMSLAAELADDEVIAAELLTMQERKSTRDLSLAEDRIKAHMNQRIAETEQERPEFAKAKLESEFKHFKKSQDWQVMVMYFSHHISMEKTLDNQVWLVD